MQQLVVDVEDEFHTLRERYDYVMAGRHGGDCPADVKSAQLLARRLLELGVSAILGIYELRAHDRIRFVRLFLESLVNAPRDLWHPVLVVVDEAHLFCPQTGEAESAGAVIDLMTRGRKRGFCGILATQRISKLHKDAAAEANNKLIGRTALDVDLKRAGDELGLVGKEDQRRLRTLPPGSFYAFGPAISPEVVVVSIGPVATTHPRVGQRAAPPPAPGDRVRRVLAQLADLPREAAEESRSVDELRAQLRRLEREMAAARRGGGGADPAALARARTEGQAAGAAVAARQAERAGAQQQRQLAGTLARIARARAELDHAEKDLRQLAPPAGDRDGTLPSPAPGVRPVGRPAAVPAPKAERGRAGAYEAPRSGVAVSEPGRLAPARQRILDALAFLETVGVGPADRTQLALLADQSPTSSSYANHLGALRTAGLIGYPGPASVALTDDGRAEAQAPAAPPTSDELHEMLRRKLSPARWRIVQALIDAYPSAVAKEPLADQVGQSATSSSYANHLGALRSLGLIDYPDRGLVVACPVLFLEGR